MKNDTRHTSDPDSRRAEQIYFEAVDIEDETERRTFVSECCDSNAAVRQKVEALFGLQGEATEIFDAHNPTRISAADIANSITQIPEFFAEMKTALPDDDEVGKQIGNYKLLQKIGEGGVGNVYLAEQSKPVRRQVAFKIIKAGMDTKSVIARFEAERQALAMMEHPNIAHVLNAGETERGRPYFVMELVHGERITTYCDEHELTILKRLELFVEICHAIQHAHQKGIIHRDIKPSNVLITMHDGEPSPVVIDFGIAKATTGDLLTEKTVNTAMGPIIGTPAYMSPEQTNLTQHDIDTRCDIYSLGVLLYELLTGITPFDHKELLKTGIDEMCRILREKEPPRPSDRFDELGSDDKWTVAKHRHVDPRKLYALLCGDLDWIVMKALEKDRTRRYETANAMAMDIEHFLNYEPVMARPPSRTYRLRKLVRRNKTTFAYLIAIFILVLAGLGTVSWLLMQQTKLRVAAEDRERIAHAAFLIGQNRIEEADQIVEAVTTELMPSLEVESVLRKLGEWNALKGRWDQAADLFTSLLKVDIMDNSWAISSDLLMAGPVLIESGDIEGYKEFRRLAINRHLGTEDWNAAERTIKISLLIPADDDILAQLKPFADLTLANTAIPPPEIMAAWRCISMALSSYRRGFLPTAIAWCERSRMFNADATARVATSHVIEAMAHYQLDEIDESRTQFDKGRAMVDEHFAAGLSEGDGWSGFWYDWLFARILLREAEALIK